MDSAGASANPAIKAAAVKSLEIIMVHLPSGSVCGLLLPYTACLRMGGRLGFSAALKPVRGNPCGRPRPAPYRPANLAQWVPTSLHNVALGLSPTGPTRGPDTRRDRVGPPRASGGPVDHGASVAKGQARQLFLEQLLLGPVARPCKSVRELEKTIALSIVGLEPGFDQIGDDAASTRLLCPSERPYLAGHARREAHALSQDPR